MNFRIEDSIDAFAEAVATLEVGEVASRGEKSWRRRAHGDVPKALLFIPIRRARVFFS